MYFKNFVIMVEETRDTKFLKFCNNGRRNKGHNILKILYK